MGSKNNPGDFDCYANAAPDEPMFVLLGRDRHAAVLVEIWAFLRACEEEEPAKVAEAMRCANAMHRWCRSLGKEPMASDDVVLPLTRGLSEHPGGYDGPCECMECRSYD